jgi:hypothetical protein
VGLGAVGGDGGAVVAEVDVGLVAGDALACDAGALEATDELLGFTGEHGADDYFDSAGGGGGHCGAFTSGYPVILTSFEGGVAVDFPVRIYLLWWSAVFAGVF